jgi:hypothetical protein
MARPLNNGRTSLSSTEKEVAGAMFQVVADLLTDGRVTEDEILFRVRENLQLANDLDLPPEAQHEEDEPETTEEWGDVERRRASIIEEMAPLATAETAAEFGTRLALVDELRKW